MRASTGTRPAPSASAGSQSSTRAPPGISRCARATGGTWIVFNGEIYNYVELAEQLSAEGLRLRSRADTEVLLELFARVGEDVVHDLRGMYAFAIWDARRRELFAARDAFGIKPLFYERGTACCGWRPKRRRCWRGPSTRRQTATPCAAISRSSSSRRPPPRRRASMCCRRLTLTARAGGDVEVRYWRARWLARAPLTPGHRAEDRVGVRDSVRVHLRSDGRWGLPLRRDRLCHDLCAGRRGAPRSADLHRWIRARRATARSSMRKHMEDPGPRAASVHRHGRGVRGMPAANRVAPGRPSGGRVGGAAVVRRPGAHKHVKVVLSGEGADELFGATTTIASCRWLRQMGL